MLRRGREKRGLMRCGRQVRVLVEKMDEWERERREIAEKRKREERTDEMWKRFKKLDDVCVLKKGR